MAWGLDVLESALCSLLDCHLLYSTRTGRSCALCFPQMSTCDWYEGVWKSCGECYAAVMSFRMTGLVWVGDDLGGGVYIHVETHRFLDSRNSTVSAIMYQDKIFGRIVSLYAGAGQCPASCDRSMWLVLGGWRNWDHGLMLAWPKSKRTPPGCTSDCPKVMPQSISGRRSPRTPSFIWLGYAQHCQAWIQAHGCHTYCWVPFWDCNEISAKWTSLLHHFYTLICRVSLNSFPSKDVGMLGVKGIVSFITHHSAHIRTDIQQLVFFIEI